MSRSLLERLRSRRGRKLAEEIVNARLTFLETDALLDLRDRAQEMERNRVPGAFVEAGCALGGSAIMIARSKHRTRPLFVYDVFGMIPPPGQQDGEDVHDRYRVITSGEAAGLGDDVYYGYQPDLEKAVEAAFRRFGCPCATSNVTLVKGLFEDTLHPPRPVAFAHIDGDWYASVKTCLERIWPKLSPGGAIVVDDYDSWSGCRTAVDEFLAERSDYRMERRVRPHIIRA